MTPYGAHWADVLTLRDEVRRTDGSVDELQMSLAKAAYQTVPVPYARCDYYTDITQPTPLLVDFFAQVGRRLGTGGSAARACFHLDQGMGGGKSHALVGLWHMITSPEVFLASELGQAVTAEAAAGGAALDLDTVIPAVLIGDSMSPGRTDPRFGPATDLFGRLLWLMFAGHPDRMGRWRHYVDLGANKATLQAAFAEAAQPVLIIIDELMDYAMQLSDETAIGGLPGEQAFLNALTDAVDDQPQVALVVVLIRSDMDEKGYRPAAADLREYLAPRLVRNGTTVTVTEPADFAEIIRRRLFERANPEPAARAVAGAYLAAADEAWTTQVYGRLGAGRTLGQLPERTVGTYPFHPDLFDLVTKEWSKVQAFQRVRSTVAIFAKTALHWATQHEAGRYAPDLIGPGDLPLHTNALGELLSSGVLAGSARAVQGFRAVASTDIIRSGGGDGTAFRLDVTLASDGVSAGQPTPALRMATACFIYSLVPRASAERGATKAELVAALSGPGVPFTGAEEAFNALIAGPVRGGLGALERTKPAGGRGAERFYLSIKQTLNMYHANAMTMVSHDQALERVWSRAQQLAVKGGFREPLAIDQSTDGRTAVADCFADTDSQENRLVLLDPRRWTLLNGRDRATREDLDIVFGVRQGLSSTYAASMVVALVNTQRRVRARDRARELLAWESVVTQLDPEADDYTEARSRRDESRAKLDADIRRAYQHYAYLLRKSDGQAVEYRTVPDGKTSLSGPEVWADLVSAHRAVGKGSLSADYVGQLIREGGFDRDLTPRELFALPYSDPNWPLIASTEDLRAALFTLATGPEWMLTDSDGSEIRPATPGQIQHGSMHQSLRPRPLPKPVLPVPSDPGPANVRLTHALFPPAGADGVDGDPSVGSTDARGGSGAAPGTGSGSTTYEITKLRMPLSSLSDESRRDTVWRLLRELANLVDPSRAGILDVQMIGLDIQLTARAGDTAKLVALARALPNLATTVREEDGF
ncbi:DUF499 domain-containing protein [Frankia sp. Hr75.2]|nr:DUF499 domain-containing protein [Frankia sp. Hr75.2]